MHMIFHLEPEQGREFFKKKFSFPLNTLFCVLHESSFHGFLDLQHMSVLSKAAACLWSLLVNVHAYML